MQNEKDVTPRVVGGDFVLIYKCVVTLLAKSRIPHILEKICTTPRTSQASRNSNPSVKLCIAGACYVTRKRISNVDL